MPDDARARRATRTMRALRRLGRRWPAMRLVARALEVDRRLTLGYVACIVGGGALPPAFTVATGGLVAAVSRAGGADGDASRAWLAFGALGALYLIQRLLAPIQQDVGNALARRLDEALTEQLMTAMSAPPGLAHVEDPAMLDAIARAQGTLLGVSPGSAIFGLGWVWMQRLQGALALAIVGAWRWWAALALVAVYAPTYAATRWHWHHVTRVMYGRTEEMRRSYYLRKLALSPDIAKETRVFGLAGWLVERYRTGWLAVMREVWRLRREGWIIAVAVYALVAAAEAGVALIAARQAVSGELPVGDAVTLAGAIAAAAIVAFFHDLHFMVGAGFDALGKLDELERTTAERAGVTGGAASAGDLPRRTIRFEGVRFGYAGRDQPVFAALDLEIEAGRSLAIVGENGAGKTTLVKLLARLYDPQAGRITVDGIDLRDLAPAAWHRRVAAIFQDFVQFELSAEDNVGFGALHRRGDREALARAADQAGAGAVIGRLAAGWQTPLSRQVSGGIQLSGGEWQRLALARALFAVQAGAGVLVLDEPTAALDVRGEAEVYERFLELTRGVTTIVISHRFSTVRRADRIVVLEHGAVIEDGSHDALVAAGGRYAEMYALQAARFTDAAGGGSGSAGGGRDA
ncbi:MAG TPA: ATP-binding cassette domain-containing protein [Kofleriaceae bacterium]|nr:ATP-binding cassette domain-containing protein [Kofleriaceae bacterium]